MNLCMWTNPGTRSVAQTGSLPCRGLAACRFSARSTYPLKGERLADYQSAIQQAASLRYLCLPAIGNQVLQTCSIIVS